MSGKDTDESDESLVLRIQKGEHQAFAQLVRRHSTRFYAVAYRTFPYKEEAEDVVQEAFLKLWNRPELYKIDNRGGNKSAKFTTWFYRVVVNMALDHARKQAKFNNAATDIDFIADEKPGNDTDMIEKERQVLLENAIQALPVKQKTALNLCFYEGLSNKEAAEIIGVSVKALEALLVRAKSGIRNNLIRDGLLEEKHHGT